MAYVRVEQRNARLAAPVKVNTVQGEEGPLTKGTFVAISNVRKGVGEAREKETTSIQWTLWGKLAENAAEYLTKGSRVNVVGRVQNNNYTDSGGHAVYALAFTCEELDYLDSRQESEARRAVQLPQTPASPQSVLARGKASRSARRTVPESTAAKADDIPF